MTRIQTPILLIALICLLPACGEGLLDGSDTPDTAVESSLTGAQRRDRSTLIKQAAHEKGFYNPVLLAGIAMAETNMAHCWSEATWACKGPASSSCDGGPVIAGSGDGPCAIKQGGLGYFQFDSGTHGQTLATYGQDVLTVEGNTAHAVEYMIKRVIWSDYISGVQTREQALAWINDVRPNNDKWHLWIKTVTHYYNGCVPGRCSVYNQRYNKYASNTLAIYNELGHDFWYDRSQPIEPPVDPPTPDNQEMDLPWSCNESFRVTQGHNTNFSHYGKGAWAWDFGTPVGEDLLAVKDGVVRMVKSTSTSHGCSSAYANSANYVVLDFGDGTEALYLHLQAGTVAVKQGDRVKRGQFLGKVGLSGWVCGAHLHFQIQRTCNSWWCQSIQASFRTIGDPEYNQTVTSQNCGERPEPTDVSVPTGLEPQGAEIANGDAISLQWSRISSAQSYDVKMQHKVNGQWATYYQWDNYTRNEMEVFPQFTNRDYQWAVRACNASGCSDWSAFSGFKVGEAQQATTSHITSPANNSVVTSNGVNVQWQAMPGATSYRIRLEMKKGTGWSHYYTWSRTNTQMTIWPVSRNAQYRLSVQTCKGSDCGEFSTPAVFHY